MCIFIFLASEHHLNFVLLVHIVVELWVSVMEVDIAVTVLVCMRGLALLTLRPGWRAREINGMNN